MDTHTITSCNDPNCKLHQAELDSSTQKLRKLHSLKNSLKNYDNFQEVLEVAKEAASLQATMTIEERLAFYAVMYFMGEPGEDDDMEEEGEEEEDEEDEDEEEDYEEDYDDEEEDDDDVALPSISDVIGRLVNHNPIYFQGTLMTPDGVPLFPEILPKGKAPNKPPTAAPTTTTTTTKNPTRVQPGFKNKSMNGK
ncbi:hypothetical protein G210_3873 [Candida maltosa Xu316]|uniref:Uncharacterized protein n=1 Tax=Candida maltosa (strain Xu316) TaxID=1245528 RepID=M3HF81_CANMX|nr:hypothetical protein G210_3873 [Candida maltosa Xu316]